MANEPAPILPRAALERVLLRAAELHAASAVQRENVRIAF